VLQESGSNTSVFAVVLIVFMAMFGAAAKYIGTMAKSKFSAVLFWGNIFVAAFIGLLISLICAEYEVSRNLAGVAAGIAGYMGHVFIDHLASRFEKTVNSKVDRIIGEEDFKKEE
jgi:hypothetical protein